jgi:hypothetical protein
LGGFCCVAVTPGFDGEAVAEVDDRFAQIVMGSDAGESEDVVGGLGAADCPPSVAVGCPVLQPATQ